MPKLELGDLEGVAARRAPGVGRAAAVDRQGLRRDRADAVLRADAEVRMAADPAQGSRGRAAVAGDLRHLRVRRRHRQEGGPGARACSRSRAASACISPAMRGRRTWAPKAAEMLRLIPKTRVAVIERCSGHGGIWGARTENFETAVKVGKPARPGRHQERHQLRRLGMPAGRRSPDAGDGDDGGRADAEALARRSSDRADGARLRTDGDSHDAACDRSLRPSCRSTEYVKLRAERRRQISEIKKNRRLEVGPVRDVLLRDPTTTMLHQVHEMLFIEKGGAGADSRRARGLQSADPAGQRAGRHGDVRDRRSDPPRPRAGACWAASRTRPSSGSAATVIRGVPEGDQERSRDDGKASSVQFVRFPFTAGPDRGVPRRRRRCRGRLRSSQLRPHGGDAAGRAPGAVGRLLLIFRTARVLARAHERCEEARGPEDKTSAPAPVGRRSSAGPGSPDHPACRSAPAGRARPCGWPRAQPDR